MPEDLDGKVATTDIAEVVRDDPPATKGIAVRSHRILGTSPPRQVIIGNFIQDRLSLAIEILNGHRLLGSAPDHAGSVDFRLPAHAEGWLLTRFCHGSCSRRGRSVIDQDRGRERRRPRGQNFRQQATHRATAWGCSGTPGLRGNDLSRHRRPSGCRRHSRRRSRHPGTP